MRGATAVICGAVLGCGALCGPRISAQEEGRGPDAWTPAVVTGAAFSAVRYTRTVRVQPDGSRITIAERHRILVARDADGRIFMSGADRAGDDCDLPSLGKLPICDYWELLLFDPSAGVMWHWSEGEIGDKTQLVLMDLREEQIAEAERETSVLERPAEDPPEAGVSVQNLGERGFGGITARGVRTTVEEEEPEGRRRLRIHEVWSSVKMRLVLMTIDGDPMGEETISGLCKISLAPDSFLFRPPSDRILRHWKDSSRYAASDIADELSLWPVK